MGLAQDRELLVIDLQSCDSGMLRKISQYP